MIISPHSAAATNSISIAVATASTAAAELPRAGSDLYFVATTTACFLNAGASDLAAASTTVYSFFLPANFYGVLRIPGEYVRAIRLTADGTMVITAIKETSL